MSLCPRCGEAACSHTPEERGQNLEEINRPLTREEGEALRKEPVGSLAILLLAKKNAHSPA